MHIESAIYSALKLFTGLAFATPSVCNATNINVNKPKLRIEITNGISVKSTLYA